MKYKMFKSVNKDLSSKYDSTFKYEVGKTYKLKEGEYDESREECSTGLHCSNLIYAKGYNWNKEQKILLVEVEDKDIIVKGDNKFRCKKIKIIKILTKQEVDKQLEKEFTDKFRKKGLWNYVKEFENKKCLNKKITKSDKTKIKKLLLNTNKNLSPYGWNYKSNVRFIQVDSLWDSLGDSLWDSLGDSLWYSLRDSLWDSLWYSLACKISDKHKSDTLDSLIEIFRMGYLVAGKDKEGNWLVIVSKDKNFKESVESLE